MPSMVPTPRLDSDLLQARHGVSAEAVEVLAACDVIDLHIDTFIPPRLFGYDLEREHGLGLLRGRFFGHLDVPRIRRGGLTGAMWSITTNPFRSAASRLKVFERNLRRFEAFVAASDGALVFACTASEYEAAKAQGAHAVLLSIQGGNALSASAAGPAHVPGRRLVRVTLVHLTSSVFGSTSSPFSLLDRRRELTPAGARFIEQCDAERVFVDLAHIHRTAFWQAVDAHQPDLPLIATHTGVCGVRPHWRNLDDAQLRAIADSGGVVGIIFASQFLSRRGGPKDANMVVEHLEHVSRVAGDAAMAVGTDYDGAITPPHDLRNGTAYVRLVQTMLDRGWPFERIRGALGGNFLSSFARMRPPPASALGTKS